jgi:hypothetical protein
MREASNPNADFGTEYLEAVRNPTEPGLSETARLRTPHEASRLALLHRMGRAESTGGASWLGRRDSEQVLRATQCSADRQKTLAAHGALLSDDRLPMTTLDVRDLTSIEARILVHGEEETSGRQRMASSRRRITIAISRVLVVIGSFSSRRYQRGSRAAVALIRQRSEIAVSRFQT